MSEESETKSPREISEPCYDVFKGHPLLCLPITPGVKSKAWRFGVSQAKAFYEVIDRIHRNITDEGPEVKPFSIILYPKADFEKEIILTPAQQRTLVKYRVDLKRFIEEKGMDKNGRPIKLKETKYERGRHPEQTTFI